MKNVTILLIVFLSFLLTNCTKLDTYSDINLPITKTIRLKSMSINLMEDMLHFKDKAEYLDFIQLIRGMDEADYLDWASTTSVVTHRLAYHNLLEEMHSAESESKFYELINSNCDIVYLSEESGEPEVERTIDNTIYSSITNIKGEFCIGDTVFKVIKNFIVYGPISQIKYLDLIEINDGNESLPSGFLIDQYMYTKNLKTGCGDDLSAEVIYDPSLCKNDRKLKLTMKVSGYSSWDHTEFHVDIEVETKSSYKLFCVWAGGPSTHFQKDISVTVVSPCGTDAKTLTDGSKSNTTYYTRGIHYYCEETQGPLPYFSAACGKGSSDGVGWTNYAVISCNCN